jgi:hypothetical protein
LLGAEKEMPATSRTATAMITVVLAFMTKPPCQKVTIGLVSKTYVYKHDVPSHVALPETDLLLDHLLHYI